jgi:ribosome biogenesis protein ENP2
VRTEKQQRLAKLNLVPAHAQAESNGVSRNSTREASFGQRRALTDKGKGRSDVRDRTADGVMETSWLPSQTRSDEDDMLGGGRKSRKSGSRPKGVETFGLGLEKGRVGQEVEMTENQRKGRTERRKGMRSGSKNVFRRLG